MGPDGKSHGACASRENGAHEWITVAEAAQRCRVHPVALRRAARVGHLEARASGQGVADQPGRRAGGLRIGAVGEAMGRPSRISLLPVLHTRSRPTGLRLSASDGRRRTRYARRRGRATGAHLGRPARRAGGRDGLRPALPAGAGLADRRGDRRRGAARRVGGAAGADGEPRRGGRRGPGLPALRLAGVAGRGGRPAPGGGRRLAGLAGRPVDGLVDGAGRGRHRPRRVGLARGGVPVAGPRPGHRWTAGRGRGPSRSPTRPRSWPGPSSRASPAPAPDPPARRPAAGSERGTPARTTGHGRGA